LSLSKRQLLIESCASNVFFMSDLSAWMQIYPFREISHLGTYVRIWAFM